MSLEEFTIFGVALSLLAHLLHFVWWASRVTNRIEHLEKWVSNNNRTAERLQGIESKLDILILLKQEGPS